MIHVPSIQLADIFTSLTGPHEAYAHTRRELSWVDSDTDLLLRYRNEEDTSIAATVHVVKIALRETGAYSSIDHSAQLDDVVHYQIGALCSIDTQTTPVEISSWNDGWLRMQTAEDFTPETSVHDARLLYEQLDILEMALRNNPYSV